MKVFLKRVGVFVVLFLTLLSASPVEQSGIHLTKKEKTFLKRHPIITAQNEADYPPYNFIKDGKAQGFSIDYLNLLARKLGIKVRYISGHTWAEFMKMARHNQIDVMLNIMRTPEREKYLHFTQPYTGNKKGIFTNDPTVQTLRDLNGKTVSVIRNYFMQHFLEAYHPGITLKLEKDARSCIQSVKDGSSDATVGSSGIMQYIMKENNLYLAYGMLINDRRLSLDLNIATSPKNALLRDILQKAMYTVSDKELNAIKARWIGGRELKIPVTGTLTKEEQAYLRKKSVIKMCIDPDWEPIEFADMTNGFATKGITTDTMNVIGKELNVTFQGVPTDSWSQSQRFLKERKNAISSPPQPKRKNGRPMRVLPPRISITNWPSSPKKTSALSAA